MVARRADLPQKGGGPGRGAGIPSAPLTAVKEAATSLQVAELLGVKLKREGDHFKGRCPLPGHGKQTGKTPPFTVYDGGGWKCYGCGEGGPDGIALYQAVHGTRFSETILELGELLLAGSAVDPPPGNGNGARPLATKPAARAAVALAALGGEWTPSTEPPAELTHKTHGAPSHAWRVRDAAGRLFALHCRFETPEGKTFAWWRNGEWTLGGVKVATAPLYGAELLRSEWDQGAGVVVTEGEKAADALRARGLQAVATVCGSGTTPEAGALAVLGGWRGPVILWPDNDSDGKGRAHMERVRAALPPGLDVRTFAPSDLPPKGDAVEWLASRTAEAPKAGLLAEILIGAAKYRPAEDTAPGVSEFPAPVRPVWQSLDDFCNAPDDSPEPLVGTEENCFLPAGGLLLLFGDGGSGKTTLSDDFIAHGASGTEWLGLPIARPLKILVIENEGPRAEFRGKLRKKRGGWRGKPFAHNVRVWTEPWAGLTLADESHRQTLAEEIDAFGADVVVMGPLASLGAKGAGTPDDVTEFEKLLVDLRGRCRKAFALWIVHHENKGGGISGAWTRVPDALLHMLKQGNGRSLLKLEKMRWASELHDTSWNLCWEGGDGFRREDAPVAKDYQAMVLAALADGAWHSQDGVREATGAGTAKIRDALSALKRAGVVDFCKGAPGFPPNAHCYRFHRACSDPPNKGNQAEQGTLPGVTDAGACSACSP